MRLGGLVLYWVLFVLLMSAASACLFVSADMPMVGGKLYEHLLDGDFCFIED